MKKISRTCVSILLMLIWMISLIFPVYGATATGSISLAVSGNNTPGGTITVPIVLKTTTVVSGADITISYPSNLVSFVSSSDPGNTYASGNTVQIVNFRMNVSANSSVTVATLTFKIKDGTAGKSGTFSVSRADVTDHLNNEVAFQPSRGSASVTVVAPKSTNANLASLTVNAGALSPAFSAGQTSYAVTVPNSVSSITIGATAADSKAAVSGTGAKNLNVGSNKFSVVVKAESGATKTYIVTVTRQAAQTVKPTESTTPTTSKAPIAPVAPSSVAPVSSSVSSEPVSSEESVSSELLSSEPEAESDSVSSESVSSQEPEQQGERPDYTWMTVHILYIGGMLICLALGAAFGFFIRGRRG